MPYWLCFDCEHQVSLPAEVKPPDPCPACEAGTLEQVD